MFDFCPRFLGYSFVSWSLFMLLGYVLTIEACVRIRNVFFKYIKS